MSTVSSISIFFITAFQQQPFRYSFFRSFTVLHRRAPKSSLHHGVFLCLTRAFFGTWFPKSKTAASQSICKSHFHTKLQGCAAARCGERTSPDCQTYFAAHDDQLSCSICGLPASVLCLCCENRFCRSHIYQCRECQSAFCGDCLDLHNLEGHWSDSDTASAMVASMYRRPAHSQPTERSSTRCPKRGFPIASCLSFVPRNSQVLSWNSTVCALMAHSARRLFSISELFSPEAAQ